MSITKNYLISLLLYISIVNEVRHPQVTCEDEGSQCIPKSVFMALLRLPEVRSNLAAYSRTARVIQDSKTRSEMTNLKALTEEGNDAEICVPGRIYLELLRDPAMRGHLSSTGRTQKLPPYPGRLFEDTEEADSGELYPESSKRSLATLAKNDDLPFSIQEREDSDDEEKRSIAGNEDSDMTSHGNAARILQEYVLSNGELDLEALRHDFPTEKRNVGSLARDFALPPQGRRNVASFVRDYGLSSKRNIRTANMADALSASGKRNVAALARTDRLPQTGKRNVASMARQSVLPYGKRFVDSLIKNGAYPLPTEDKRSVSSLARNSNLPGFAKRGLSAPGAIILRTLSRQGRSLSNNFANEYDSPNFEDLESLARNGMEQERRPIGIKEHFGNSQMKNKSDRTFDDSEWRSRDEYDPFDDYTLSAVQKPSLLDYDEMMEGLAEKHPNYEKRFMGSQAEIQTEVSPTGQTEIFQASKRHIAALARLGWLPTHTTRFSRSPRYLVSRKNTANGPASDYSANPPTWTLGPNFNPRTRYVRALHRIVDAASRDSPNSRMIFRVRNGPYRRDQCKLPD